MIGLISSEQIAVMAILLVALVLLLTERIRIDLTAILIIIALAGTKILTPEQALSGFASEPAIVAAAIFVLSGAMYYTGLSDRIGVWIGRWAGRGYNRMVAIVMTAVAALSAFTHHLTITAVMLPVTLKLSQEHDVPASRLLMPMSMAASLGTTITILGAPAFLIADRILKQAGQEGLAVFSIAPIGLALTVVGTVFILTFGRWLLPVRSSGSGDLNKERFQLDGYYTELVIDEDSPFVGSTVAEFEDKESARFQIAGWMRGGYPRSRPFAEKHLQAHDVLLVRTTSDELATIQQEPGISLRPLAKYKNGEAEADKDAASDEQLVQAVIAPQSELVGRSIGQMNFFERYNLIVVSIWRRNAWLRAKLSRVRLRAGDVLLLRGDTAALERLAQNRSFLMLVPFKGESFMRHKASVTALIIILSVITAALEIVPVPIALLTGTAAVLLCRCLTPDQAYRSIDTRIYVFIAGAIPLGLAMEETGTSDLLASWLQTIVAGWPPLLILFLLFIASAVITQMMSDAGTVAMLGPVAIALARGLNHSPTAYVVVVAMAAVASFLTPIGHHGNLLVYGPGGYRFSDFLKVGTPLTVLVALVTTFMAQFLWPSG